MRFTKRLLDRATSGHARTARTSFGIVAVGLLLGAGPGSFVACSSDDASPGTPGEVDGGAPEPETGVGDAGSPLDATTDAADFDAAPLPVVCTSPSCATALVTTRGLTDADRAEGFCALLHDGTVACWGANGAGQLGRGDDAGSLDSPIAEKVVGVANVSELEHTCALDVDGQVWCWGTGPFLRNEFAPTTTERTPVHVDIPEATSVGVGTMTACATVSDGVLCWGANASGQVAPLEAAPWTASLAPRLVDFRPGAAVHNVVVGRASFAFRDDGTVESWGANPPLGRVSSLFPDPYPDTMALRGVSAIDVAADNACAIVSGRGYCWGTPLPQPEPPGLHLPPGPNFDRALPEPVPMPEPIARIATTRMVPADAAENSLLQPQRWCACSASGAVYCAGYNASGQAGDGTKNFVYDAVKVVGLPAPAADVKALPDSTCALLTTGQVFCWGANTYGQLGTGKMKVPSLVPEEVVLP